ncbi:hypothetical protein PISMIDRAFT_672195 [Pisolithus microcarpus 441]|uniref:Unplaced genomic scaffold scaffold_5, whole genome shotgun sequence n=1 Tax=Pisolithus microcarpus 441 TaxID=765257 RepID=A0A0D0AC00_9AGAM|nr:hypothetical protein BKA83DRAFT_672195 [Pisolithus microcarpus]KIK29503.1 hypothetical protein PISMIDRAFT_672195 [Pisolithus microcarpus 441]
MSSTEIAGYRVVFQKGITGGFAPPTPSALYCLEVSEDATELNITSHIRPDGTPVLQPPVTKTLELNDDEIVLLATLKSILSSVPPQYPGAQDFYGRDISIVATQDPQATSGGVPYGTAAARALQPPTEEQVEKFNRAVEIVRRLVAEVEY